MGDQVHTDVIFFIVGGCCALGAYIVVIIMAHLLKIIGYILFHLMCSFLRVTGLQRRVDEMQEHQLAAQLELRREFARGVRARRMEDFDGQLAAIDEFDQEEHEQYDVTEMDDNWRLTRLEKHIQEIEQKMSGVSRFSES
jgi:hypothetical protein